MLDEITPLIIAYDEAANLRRVLAKLAWARRIVIVDSGSRDDTRSIIAQYPQADVFEHPFTDFASQCNFGIEQIATPWVLSLDADYELTDALIDEMRSLSPVQEIAGYRARFVYRIHGRPLRGSLYPPRVVLYRQARAVYRNEGHGHRVSITGTVLPLSAPIYHDDRKPIARWFASQQRYARNEAEHLLSSDRDKLGRVDRIRLSAWPAPIAALIYTLLAKGCLFDGWPGWYYALQRTLVEILIAIEIIDRRLRRD